MGPSAVAPLRPVAPRAVVGHVSATQAAYDAGVEAGRAAALAEVAEAHEASHKAMEDAAAALHQAAGRLRAVRAEAVRADAHDAMSLVVELVEAIVGALPPSLDGSRLEDALALAPDDELAVVRLHPDDASAALSLPIEAKVVADPAVEHGGCIVEVGPARIDAQIGPALRRLRAVLGAGDGR